MTKQLIPNGGNCLASVALLEGKEPLLWAFREKSLMPSDSGWRFFAATDTQTEVMDGKSILLVDINKIAEMEPSVASIYWYPEGADFQLASKDGSKYFVYNDTFERVLPATSLKELPVDTPAFQKHFDMETIDSSSIIEESNQMHMTADQMDMLKLLDLMHTQEVHMLSKVEVYMNAGLLFGFVQARNHQLDMAVTTNQINDIAKTMMDYFNIDRKTAEAYVDQYVDLDVNSNAIAERQLVMYGGKMYDWLQSDQFVPIKDEYASLVMHHRKSHMV